MDKIVIIQPIFIIDEETYRQQDESIISLFDYWMAKPHTVQIIFGGYCSEEKYWQKITRTLQTLHVFLWKINEQKVLLHKFDKNYGKAYVVNYLWENCADKDANWLLTYDSDIKFPLFEPNIFERCINVAKNINNQNIHSQLLNSKIAKNDIKFGMIALNQMEGIGLGGCHLFGKDEIYNRQTVGDEIVAWKDDGSSIAGGAIFFNAIAWQEIGGYRLMGIYAGDDAFCQHDLWQKGYTCTLAQTINIMHPNKQAIDMKYENWKKQSLINSIYGVKIEEEELQKQIDKYRIEVEKGI
jgi:hypothetical protein